MTGQTICVAAVDEQEAARYGLQRWLSAADDSIVVTGSAPDVAALLAGPGRDADVVLLDAGHAVRATLPADIRALAGAGHAVVVTAGSVCSQLARVAFGNGASGLLNKTGPAACAVRVIRAAVHGDALIPLPLVRELTAAAIEVRLSPQEAAATRLYAAGMPLASVARRMQLSPQTVKQYVDRARAKYRSVGRPCPTKVHLYQRLIEDGLVDA